MVHGLKSQNFFPSVGANGPCIVHVNFGQAGFVFIEANVKKWGLAPMTGSLAPPPPYGSEQGSILLETGRKDGYVGSTYHRGHQGSQSVQLYSRPNLDPGHNRSRSGNFRVLPPTSPGPQRSPTDISLAHLVPAEEGGEPSSAAGAALDEDEPHQQPAGLDVNDPNQPPPPEYTSPEHSDAEDDGSGGNSTDDEDRPLISLTRSRGNSAATVVRANRSYSNAGRSSQGRPSSPPIPSYQDAILQGAGRDRSGSTRSARAGR